LHRLQTTTNTETARPNRLERIEAHAMPMHPNVRSVLSSPQPGRAAALSLSPRAAL
jgi:hypothetical protein